MSWDEWYLVSLQDILSLIMFSGKTLHCSIPMTSLVTSLKTLLVLQKVI